MIPRWRPSTPDADRHEEGSTVDTRRNPTPAARPRMQLCPAQQHRRTILRCGRAGRGLGGRSNQ